MTSSSPNSNRIALRRMHSARYSDGAARESVDSMEIFDVDSASLTDGGVKSEKGFESSAATGAGGGSWNGYFGANGSRLSMQGLGSATLRAARREERPLDGVARAVALVSPSFHSQGCSQY